MTTDKLCPICHPVCKIKLPGGRFAIIDAEDQGRASICKWTYSRSNNRVGYARNKRVGYLHRFIMQAPEGCEVDHVNGDTLDNRKSNLRICSPSQNRINHRLPKVIGTSKYRGVSWNKKNKKWVAFVSHPNRPRARKNVGSFNSEIEAALAYDRSTFSMYGEYSKLNFPPILDIAGGKP